MAARCLLLALALAVLPAAQCDEVRATPQALAGIYTDFDTGKSVGFSDLLKELLKALHEETQLKDIQWVVALCGFILGMAALADGRAIFKTLIITICAAAGFIFALATFKADWKEEESHGTLFAIIASVEIAFAVGYVSWKGLEGVRYGVGMTIGFLMFQEAKVLCEVNSLTYLEGPVGACIAGTILVLFGFFLFSEGMETVTFGFLAPIVGAGAVCASIGYFVLFGITFIPEETQKSIFEKAIAGTKLLPDIPSYEDYLLMLFTWRQPVVVGFFTAADANTIVGSMTIHWDLWLGRFFLAIFALTGVYYQWKKGAKARKESKRKAYKGPLANRLLVKKPGMV